MNTNLLPGNLALAALGPDALGIIVVCRGSRSIAPLPSPMPIPTLAGRTIGLDPNPSP